MGALSTLFAVTAPNVQGGDFFDPSGFGYMRGYPALEVPDEKSASPSAATKLWAFSEMLAKLSFEVK